jgi:heme-degrading monooxygenase HmoA
LVCLA